MLTIAVVVSIGIVALADVAHSGHDATTVDVLKVVSARD